MAFRWSFYEDKNEPARTAWLKRVLADVPAGARILDAGAGEQRNRAHCAHLDYVSQDFCAYDGRGDGAGQHTGAWDTSKVDIVSDIASIPEPDSSFDAILCSEVLEHVPDPTRALDEFARLLKPGGRLILTAPFVSLVHLAPYHYCTGFSRYWYDVQLGKRGFVVEQLVANGDWFELLRQELARLGSTARRYGDPFWPLAYVLGLTGLVYFRIRGGRRAEDLACFGWQCIARKN